MIKDNETEEKLDIDLEENEVTLDEEKACENDKNSDEIIKNLTSELEEQKQKADEYFEHLKRSMAEFDNYKKRMVKEKDSMYASVTSDILVNILPILDNFEQATMSECKDERFKDGMVMIYNQLFETLKKFGLTEIDALNKDFDPNFHEAVMHVEDENYGEKQVIEVLRKGYMLGDKVIRHALVKVAN